MRILVGKTFGLGNAVMCVPMLKALRQLPHKDLVIDLLVGTLSDDGGALNVFKHLKNTGIIDNIHLNSATDENKYLLDYDVAIMSIPFDGRWMNGRHYRAEKVLDGRPRPDPTTTGLSSWKKHEVEYQMENAYALGFSGHVPDCSFYPEKSKGFIKDIYFGVGYKKDKDNLWSVKHWGNEKFAKLAIEILEKYPTAVIQATGDVLDWKFSLDPIQKLVNNDRFIPRITNLDKAFEIIRNCGLYVGNDTGMMHVAASFGIPCVVSYQMFGSETKNSPWGTWDIGLIEADNEEMFSGVEIAIRKYEI